MQSLQMMQVAKIIFSFPCNLKVYRDKYMLYMNWLKYLSTKFLFLTTKIDVIEQQFLPNKEITLSL
jgi:hypothetical protein